MPDIRRVVVSVLSAECEIYYIFDNCIENYGGRRKNRNKNIYYLD
jgi:hypothetical protein